VSVRVHAWVFVYFRSDSNDMTACIMCSSREVSTRPHCHCATSLRVYFTRVAQRVTVKLTRAWVW
jgi:hypothetical protein